MRVTFNQTADAPAAFIDGSPPTVNVIGCSNRPESMSPIVDYDKHSATLQRFFKRVLAAQIYGEMFSTGEYYKKSGIDLAAQHKPFTLVSLTHLDRVSSQNLQAVKAKVLPLNAAENALLSRINSAPIRLRHQTNADLGGTALTILSNKALSKAQSDTGSHTFTEDRECVSNDDFVFFGVEFCKSVDGRPMNTLHGRMDYGANAYLIDTVSPNGYLTLTDHFDHFVPNGIVSEHRGFAKQFSVVNQEVCRSVQGPKGCHDVPLYSVVDMRLALALHLVEFLRLSADQEFKAFVLRSSLTDVELDRVINLVFQPEFHVPRAVRTDNYHRVATRSMDLFEAVNASNFSVLERLVVTQEAAGNAMGEAVKSGRHTVVAFLFENWSFTPEDAMHMTSLDLEYELSQANANIQVLKEFLQRGLVQVNRQFRQINTGQTMLDNAIKYHNQPMIDLLSQYGALRGAFTL